MNPPDSPTWRLHRPALLAWRGRDTLQVAVPATVVALERVPPAVADAVNLLLEPHTAAQLAQRLPALDEAWIHWLCAHLSSAGILTDTPKPEPAPVLLFGEGRLARALAKALTTAEVRVYPLAADAGEDQLHDRLVIVADEHVEPDRAVIARLTNAGAPHLIVRVEPSRAVVGPLVVPGRTACVRCDDLARCHFDDQWPTVLAQLCAITPVMDPGLLAWAAAMAAAQVRSWVSGGEPETLGRCLELGVDDFRLRSRTWPVQPDCCAALGASLLRQAG